jgi:PKD repeat protein
MAAFPNLYYLCSTVKLIIMKNILCILAFLVAFGTAGAQCTANFSLYDSSGAIYGINASTGADTVEWYVYDGSGTLIQVYSSWDLVHPTSGGMGVYTVCLFGYNTPSWAFCDSACQTITTMGGGSSCVADFWSSPDSLGGFYFNNNSSGTTSPVVYQWNFGDGAFSTLENPMHTYSTVGAYSVCLTITDASGCSDTFCDSVTVTAGGGSSCSADFVGLPDTSGGYGFWNLSSGTGLSYFWDFGDGAWSSLENPYHIYSAAGTYTVCLTAWNGSGCADTTCNVIYVSGSGTTLPCNANFIWFPDTASNTVYLWNLASGGSGMSYYWDFGDGSSSTIAFPSHTYATNGTYNVCLTVSDGVCTSVFCDSIWVPLKSSGFTINVVAPGGSTELNENQGGTLLDGLIYPNPVEGNALFTFSCRESFSADLIVSGIDGKVFYRFGISAKKGKNIFRLNTEKFATGLYLVSIKGEKVSASYKLLKK